MNNFSLKTLSITVIVASLASNIVFANHDINKVHAKMTEKSAQFSQLVTDYDKDNSNTLSAEEVAENEKLTKNFTKIDTNSDKEVNEQEFSDYIANIKKSLL